MLDLRGEQWARAKSPDFTLIWKYPFLGKGDFRPELATQRFAVISRIATRERADIGGAADAAIH